MAGFITPKERQLLHLCVPMGEGGRRELGGDQSDCIEARKRNKFLHIPDTFNNMLRMC